MNRKMIYLLFAGHLCTDICQGAVPALLPFFISEYHLTYSAAGVLMLALTISSSVVQPIFGFLADRISLPWFVALGPLLSGAGLAIAGSFHHYYLILLGVFICGLGVAAFHPEAARIANSAAGQRKASGMSIFSVGGNAGIALGPVITAVLVMVWGLKGTVFFLIPDLIIMVILVREVHSLSGDLPEEKISGETDPGTGSSLQNAWVPFMILTVAIVCRSIFFQGLNTFLPLYWIDAFHKSKGAASTALTILLGTGVVGNLIGGRLADRFGYQKTVLAGFLFLVPMFLFFINLTNVYVATLLLVPIGFTMYISFSPMIVLGQQCLPGHVGFASGITIGLAVSVGGFAAPFLGRLADFLGTHAVLNVITLFPILVVLLMYVLPRTWKVGAAAEGGR